MPTTPHTILRLIRESVPRNSQEEPKLSSALDALALFVNACFLANNFELVGLNKKDRLEETYTHASAGPLPPGSWNAHSATRTFRYSNPKTSLEYLVRLFKDEDTVTIMAGIVAENQTVNVEIPVSSVLADNATFPATPTASLFRGEDAMTEFKSSLRNEIMVKLLEDLNENDEHDDMVFYPQQGQAQEMQVPRPDQGDQSLPGFYGDPYSYPIPEGADRPPGFDDEYGINRPPRGSFLPGHAPLGNIGGDDLGPPPLLGSPYFDGGRQPGGFRGMHPTADDPIFNMGGQPQGGRGNPRVPHGAHYDPVNPNDPNDPNLGGPRGPFGGRGGDGGWGGGFNQFGGPGFGGGPIL